MFQRILVPLDGSATAERVLPWVESYARDGGAGLLLVRVVEPLGMEGSSGRAPASPGPRSYLRELARKLHSRGVRAERLLVEGDPAESIVRTAAAAGCDLVAMTRRGMSAARRILLESVSEAVLKISPLPVFVAPGAGTSPRRSVLRTILVPLDGSERSETILQDAERLARYHGARLILCHVSRSPGALRSAAPLEEEMKIRSAIESWCRQAMRRGVWASGHFPSGDPASKVLHFSEHGVDLIALTTHGAGGLRNWLFGSVADRILRRSEVPVYARGRCTPTVLRNPGRARAFTKAIP